MATKKVTKKSATKKAVTKSKSVKTAPKKSKTVTKKAKAIKTVQAIRDGFKKGTKLNPLPYFRYGNVSVSDVSNEKFPEMVQITNGPAKYKHLIGKKYVTPAYAMVAIDEAQAYSLIGKGASAVTKELLSAGVTPMVTTEIETENE